MTGGELVAPRREEKFLGTAAPGVGARSLVALRPKKTFWRVMLNVVKHLCCFTECSCEVAEALYCVQHNARKWFWGFFLHPI